MIRWINIMVVFEYIVVIWGGNKQTFHIFSQVFVDQLTSEDMEFIGDSIFPNIDNQIISKMVQFNNRVGRAVLLHRLPIQSFSTLCYSGSLWPLGRWHVSIFDLAAKDNARQPVELRPMFLTFSAISARRSDQKTRCPCQMGHCSHLILCWGLVW